MILNLGYIIGVSVEIYYYLLIYWETNSIYNTNIWYIKFLTFTKTDSTNNLVQHG
jgi:hypothetical protein